MEQGNIKKAKVIFSDSIYSIIALVIMNMVAQFAVYPFWARQFGAERYGDILYLLSFINIFAVSVGSALNYSRLADSAKFKTGNGEYTWIMLAMGVLGIPFSFGVRTFAGVEMGTAEVWIFWLLLFATMWRNYIDVDFRLSLNYKGYFKYYLVISVGYVIGIVLSKVTGVWELALLPGELLGIAYVFLRGDNLRKAPLRCSEEVKRTVNTCLIMLATNFILNVIFNVDRFMLKALIGGTAVTVYYLSSLLGKTVSLITTPLNSVLISYLAKYKGDFTKKMFCILLLIIAGAGFILVVGCVVGSYILIPILYPESYEMAKDFFLISSVSQVIFFATTVLTMVLLRFAKQQYQLYINLVYAVAFLILGVPLTMNDGIWGFSWAILIANFVRLVVAVFFGILDQRKRQALCM